MAFCVHACIVRRALLLLQFPVLQDSEQCSTEALGKTLPTTNSDSELRTSYCA